MTNEQKIEITKISQEFASVFKNTIGEIHGSRWLIVDPLSAYLNSIGFENELKQLPANDKHGQILIMIFKDGSKFIPAGSELSVISDGATNWMWI